MLQKLYGKSEHLSNGMVAQVCFTVCCRHLLIAEVTLPSWALPVSWTGTIGHRAGFSVSCILPPWHPGYFLHYKCLCPHGCISLYKKGFTYCFANKTIKFTNRFWNSIFSWKVTFAFLLNVWNKMHSDIIMWHFITYFWSFLMHFVYMFYDVTLVLNPL